VRWTQHRSALAQHQRRRSRVVPKPVEVNEFAPSHYFPLGAQEKARTSLI